MDESDMTMRHVKSPNGVGNSWLCDQARELFVPSLNIIKKCKLNMN